MNAIAKKLLFGICVLVSFQNALYAMDGRSYQDSINKIWSDNDKEVSAPSLYNPLYAMEKELQQQKIEDLEKESASLEQELREAGLNIQSTLLDKDKKDENLEILQKKCALLKKIKQANKKVTELHSNNGKLKKKLENIENKNHKWRKYLQDTIGFSDTTIDTSNIINLELGLKSLAKHKDEFLQQNNMLENEIKGLKAIYQNQKQLETINAHNSSNLIELNLYSFGPKASKELQKKHRVGDRALGAFKITGKPAEISYFTKYKNFLLRGIEGLAGASLEEITDAYANKKSWKPWYPFIPKGWYRSGSNAKKNQNVQARWKDSLQSFLLPEASCQLELDTTGIKDSKLSEIIENQIAEADFHENINKVVVVNELTCGDTGSKVWPFSAKLDKGTLTIRLDKATLLQPDTKDCVPHKIACTIAQYERGDWPRLRKLFLWKCLYGASLLTAFGGLAYNGAINSQNSALAENKNMVSVVTGIGGGLVGLLLANLHKKPLAKQEVIANNERAMDITKSFKGVKEACELGYYYPATSSVKYEGMGDDWEIGHTVKEVLPVLKHDLKQFPENQALPAQELLEHCRKYAIEKEYGMKHHTIKVPFEKFGD